MKKTLVLLTAIFSLFVQAAAAKKSRGPQDDASHWATIDDLADAQEHFGIYSNGGMAWSSLTRIQTQSNVSNFVWKDKMIGVYYEVQSHDLLKFNKFLSLNFMGRFAIFYPYQYTFRGVPQILKQTVLYALDWFTAPVVTVNFFNWVRLNVEPGFHMKYQLHDKWHYFNFGPGIKLEAELPIASRWTILAGGIFTWDNGNFGSNKNIRDFDYVWEWQVQLGIRYSKKYLNRRSYIRYRPKPPKTVRKRKTKTLSDDTELEAFVTDEILEELGIELEEPEEETPSEESDENSDSENVVKGVLR